MPISHTIDNPYASGTLQAWTYCAGFYVDLDTQSIHLTYFTYADQAAAYGDKPPIARAAYEILAERQPALWLDAETLARPEIPSYAEFIQDNQTAFALVQGAVDGFALSRPEFTGGEIV